MNHILNSLLALGLATGVALGQSVTFSGDVAADFPAAKFQADPGGIDVGLPTSVINLNEGGPSGWDIRGVAMSYDEATDALFVGIDFYVTAGDADGDGDADQTSLPLAALGGTDFSNFAGSESFTFALDLDADGILDVIAGLPLGFDMSGFRVALFDNSTSLGVNPLQNPYARFGAPLVSNTGGLPVLPSSSGGDIQFTIPNFSEIIGMFVTNDIEDLGYQVFAGSLEDAGIGEDFQQGIQSFKVIGDCFPVPNLYEIISKEVLFDEGPGGQIQGQGQGFDPMFELRTRYGLREGYGCCVLYSLFLQPTPIVLGTLGGAPVLEVGMFGAANSIIAIDAGVPDTGGRAVICKEATLTLAGNLLPVGTDIHAQVLAYPVGNNLGTFYLSNKVTYTFGDADNLPALF